MARVGRTRPKDPQSVWPGVPPSCVPRPTPAPRSTKKSSMEVSNSKHDELDFFREMDKVSYNYIVERVAIKIHNFRCLVVAFCNDNSSNLQSVNFSEVVPNFLLVINESLEFKPFHMGIRVSISCVVKNNIRLLNNSWSAIEEIVTSLNLYETSHKVEVIHHQLKSMSTRDRSKKLYSPEAIVLAFSYFATSRSLYKQMREDYKFPSISTLTEITSSCANQTSSTF